MNKALIIYEDSVIILDILNWENCSRDYIKLFTISGKVLVCRSCNLRLDLNREIQISDEEIVRNIIGRDMEIRYYDEENNYRLKKSL